MFILSPLEQFEVNIFLPLSFFSIFDISITNATLYMFLAFGSFLFLLFLGSYKLTVVPTRFQSVLELLYIFIFDMIKNQAGLKGQQFFPILFITFGFVLFCNVLGLTPYAFTPTSHIIVTFMLAFSFFIGLTIVGFSRQGLGFLKLFVPSGVPVAILPLMILIEIMSYCIRPISLSVRLFANMLAGHTLLHIVAGFGISLLNFSVIVALLPVFLLLAISALEFGIAFLQAYVFVILLCIYLNDSISAGH
ncbi:UNVERIFIED_CONTAM: hypothetical protein GTU68_064413 [Idotea baltica]|nr:hypothetical protein [Idotea baltica]